MNLNNIQRDQLGGNIPLDEDEPKKLYRFCGNCNVTLEDDEENEFEYCTDCYEREMDALK